ncbi:biotin carboxylase N-terminal domain-containing protein [soil metagenome]
MIQTLLIANRGEIACRIALTCRRLGIRTVAVHSDADADALHVRSCDLAVHLPGDAPADTYLRSDLLVEAARRTGADAVHPGYGFLAENADFATAVIDAGLVWVGPPPAAIEAMGSKVRAKALMRAAGVPVLPDSSVETIDEIGFPMLVKASAGGGGRGMRLVKSPDELDRAMVDAEREAVSAFGDGTVFCERYIERGRHVEVQVLADTHGRTVALHERECSIQRRHQKIVEEAPSPAVDAELRARMCTAAVAAAEGVGYEGAGTVAFLLDEHGAFAFLEMNTRLQVEHPVTEAITGLDLVELQLAVAEGRPLPTGALEPPINGHAIEVRLTAEDPDADYRPSTGTFHRVDLGEHVRVDTGIDAGSVISPHYDSMVAKVIAHGATRHDAIRKLAGALRDARIHGPTTNIAQLRRILDHPEFLAGRLHTEFLDHHPCTGAAGHDAPPTLALVAAALALQARTRDLATALAGVPSGWRNNPAVEQSVELTVGTTPGISVHRVGYRLGRVRTFSIDHEPVDLDVDPVDLGTKQVTLTVGGIRRTFGIHLVEHPGGRRAGGATVYVDDADGTVTLQEVDRFPLPGSAAAPGSLVAPMPGSIVRLHVEAGDVVSAGQALVALEAMKMEHQVHAPTDGTVTEVLVATGQQVDSGQVLLTIDPTSTDHDSVTDHETEVAT